MQGDPDKGPAARRGSREFAADEPSFSSDTATVTLPRSIVERQTSLAAVVLFLFMTMVFGYVHQRQYDFLTPLSRLNLLHAVVEQRTLCIDRWHTNTTDKAVVNGHYYSDKAPGTAALALPSFLAAHALLRIAKQESHERDSWRFCSWLACLGSQAVPAALGTVALWLWLLAWVSARIALVTVVGLFVGGIPLPYSSLLYSHAQVIGLLSVAIWALGVFRVVEASAGGEQGCGRTGRMGAHSIASLQRASCARCGLAGFCVGLAVASEYTAGLPALGLTWYAMFHRSHGRMRYLLGLILPLALVPAYSWATIGTPFDLPYSYQAAFPAMAEGLYGIKWPDLETMGQLLFSPGRGLLFWSPFLVLAGLGWWRMTSESPMKLWLCYGLPLLHIVVISGRAWDWPAGFCIAPRYLGPILPLLALPCALGVACRPRWGIGLAVLSVTLMSLATLTDACPGYAYFNPLIEFHLPLACRQEFSPNLGMLLGLWPLASVAVYIGFLVAGFAVIWRTLPPASWTPAQLSQPWPRSGDPRL